MTYTQAVTIRTLQLQGVNIGDKLLNEAIAVIKNTRTPTAWPEYGAETETKWDSTVLLRRLHAALQKAWVDRTLPATVVPADLAQAVSAHLAREGGA